jgi:hypothetical protein
VCGLNIIYLHVQNRSTVRLVVHFNNIKCGELHVNLTFVYSQGNVFTRSNAGVVGSNPTRGMDICVRLFCVCAVLCVGRGLATG